MHSINLLIFIENTFTLIYIINFYLKFSVLELKTMFLLKYAFHLTNCCNFFKLVQSLWIFYNVICDTELQSGDNQVEMQIHSAYMLINTTQFMS